MVTISAIAHIFTTSIFPRDTTFFATDTKSAGVITFLFESHATTFAMATRYAEDATSSAWVTNSCALVTV